MKSGGNYVFSGAQMYNWIYSIQAGSVLRIPNVERGDTGRYICTDENGRMQYIKLKIEGNIELTGHLKKAMCGNECGDYITVSEFRT